MSKHSRVVWQIGRLGKMVTRITKTLCQVLETDFEANEEGRIHNAQLKPFMLLHVRGKDFLFSGGS